MCPKVPNAPCGVESEELDDILVGGTQFLMHRVELKEHSCYAVLSPAPMFLMHRVELKVLGSA